MRVIVRDNLYQAAAADLFVQGSGWISVLVLAEAIWALSTNYGFSPKHSADAIEMLLNHRDFVPQDSDAVRTALDLFRQRPSLGFSDCRMLSLARKAGHLPLGTLDRNLGHVEGAHKL